MKLYLDSSAVVKLYVAESGHELAREAAGRASAWITSRITYVEVVRALGVHRNRGVRGAARFVSDWTRFEIVELNSAVAQGAAEVAVEDRLRSLDAVHLASCLRLATDDLVFATWDRALWRAARDRGLAVLPERL